MQIVEAEGVAFALTHGFAKVPDLDVLARQPSDSYVASTQKIVRHFSASYNKKIKIFVEPPVTIMAERRTCPGGLLPINPKVSRH